MNLVAALSAESSMLCVVGAGGKKSTLYALANRLDRAVVTATVRIPIFDEHVADVLVTDSPRKALESISEWPVGLVPEQERPDRYRGYDPETVASLEGCDAASILVKADGARTRLLKAPNDREPQLPRNTDVVVPIASARAVGKPLTEEFVHRPERVAEITDRRIGEEIRASDVAAVLASERGGMKDVPSGATVIPVVNMVDDDGLEKIGKEIAEQVLSEADISRVVLTQMTAQNSVVAVVE
ncbi:probable selenium-dependent hydroxylase accessory protein YqeC [Haladaptatus litoreus]|uniref:Probable selenium-dependent hydroxylase accessory protein YqeC n=1 Tax=Haladaptatus litoreus TaxID=553468 RepID=A0A1N6XX35_9EURY|nr:selenium cofactor biosynthesis protein YqeC [Haladaptatus litoreus]SIR06942.1 probable selenium-dependent hydroxylase accessory protein YqeC [Haladaptatus litoreus]